MFRKTARFLLSPFRWVIRFGLGGRTRGEKLLRRGWLSVVVLLTVGVPLAWLVLFAQLHLSEPANQYNWVEKLNATALKVPEADRAWPLYAQVIAKLDEEVNAAAFRLLEDGRWNTRFDLGQQVMAANTLLNRQSLDEFAAFADDHRATVDQLIRATNRPHIGYLFDVSVEDQLDEMIGTVFRPRPICDFQMQVLRHVLRKAYFAAVGQGDTERAIECVAVQFRLSRHFSEIGPFRFTEHGANEGIGLASKDVGLVIIELPHLFSRDDLEQLTDIFRSAQGFSLSEDLQVQFIGNTLDQIYTSGGKVTAHGAALIGSGMDRSTMAENSRKAEFARWLQPMPDSVLEKLISTVVLPVAVHWLPERETLEKDLLDRHDKWTRNGPLSAKEFEDRHRDFQRAQVMQPDTWEGVMISQLCRWPSISRVAHPTRAHAILLLIQLEQYRRRTGHWPKTLEGIDSKFIPNDPWAGGTLRYELREGGPYIWSGGGDYVDDGGVRLDPTLTVRAGYDWQLIPIEDFDPLKHRL